FAKLYDLPRAERRDRILKALANLGLQDSAGALVSTYSGGMIRRLEIAQSMLHRPPLLFLDEPTVGLDPSARRVVWEHLRRLRDEHGTTILLTTHLMDEAETLCGRIAFLHAGRIAALGTPDELKAGVGGPGVTLDDVFIHYTGATL